MTFADSTTSPEKSENKWNIIIHMEDKSTEIWKINTVIYPHLNTTSRENINCSFPEWKTH